MATFRLYHLMLLKHILEEQNDVSSLTSVNSHTLKGLGFTGTIQSSRLYHIYHVRQTHITGTCIILSDCSKHIQC